MSAILDEHDAVRLSEAAQFVHRGGDTKGMLDDDGARPAGNFARRVARIKVVCPGINIGVYGFSAGPGNCRRDGNAGKSLQNYFITFLDSGSLEQGVERGSPGRGQSGRA